MMVYMIVYDIYIIIIRTVLTHSFFPFFVVFLSIQQKTVDNPLIPVLYLLFLLLASPILLIVHCASYQTKVMC